jgi:hypothetical protein
MLRMGCATEIFVVLPTYKTQQSTCVDLLSFLLVAFALNYILIDGTAIQWPPTQLSDDFTSQHLGRHGSVVSRVVRVERIVSQ